MTGPEATVGRGPCLERTSREREGLGIKIPRVPEAHDHQVQTDEHLERLTISAIPHSFDLIHLVSN